MRVWRNVLIVALVVAALVALLIAAHGANDRNRASEAARGFLKAVDAGDQAAAERALTRRAREMMRSSDLLSGTKGKTGSEGVLPLGEPVVRDDTASVPITMKDDSGSTDATIQLRREEGEWRVRGMALSTYPGGPKFNLDFENPQDVLPEAFRTAGYALGQVTRGLQDGAAAFAKGFEQGYHEPAPQSGDRGSIQEVPFPLAPAQTR